MIIRRIFILGTLFVVSIVDSVAEPLESLEFKNQNVVSKSGWRIQDTGVKLVDVANVYSDSNSSLASSATSLSGGLLTTDKTNEWSESKSNENVLQPKTEPADKVVLARFQVDNNDDPQTWEVIAWRNRDSENPFRLKPHQHVDSVSSEWVLFQPKDTIEQSDFDILINREPRNYAYLKAVSGMNQSKLKIPEVLLAAANRTRTVLGGTLDQRMVAIYFENKTTLDQDLLYKAQLLNLPERNSLNNYDTETANQLAAELRLDGYVKSLLRENNGKAVGDLVTKQVMTESAIDHDCLSFSFEKGYLKNNLSRFLKGCGWTIGQWRFGDEQYEYDLEITKEFQAGASNLDQLLLMVEATYLLTGTKNLLDRTVDFQPSRGGTLEEMELKKW